MDAADDQFSVNLDDMFVAYQPSIDTELEGFLALVSRFSASTTYVSFVGVNMRNVVSSKLIHLRNISKV